MTITETKAYIALHGTELTLAMQTAHDCNGKPLRKYYETMHKAVNKKMKKYPQYFKSKTA